MSRIYFVFLQKKKKKKKGSSYFIDKRKKPGGLSTKSQEAALRSRPDIIVATPGRMIDHLRNTQSVHLDDIEVLILDEADRLLDMGFTDELHQIVKCCPKSRQTMLFSATISKQVLSLISISLKDPIYISVNQMLTVAEGLTQEFVRIKSNDPLEHEAMLISICKKVYKQNTIVFVQSKRLAHRLKILFGLFELPAAEIHGNLTQAQRLEAIELFREDAVNFLIATDVAARGLDIIGVQFVVNYQMPNTHSQYIHRVGRTARAGNKGSSCSFVFDEDRPLLKEIIKKSKVNVVKRTIAQNLVEKIKKEIEEFKDDIDAVIQAEKEEREIRIAERDVDKASNLIEHRKEIYGRPKKTWFQSEKEKLAAKQNSKVAVLGEEAEKEEKVEKETEEEEEKPEEKLGRRQLKKKMEKEQEKKLQFKKEARMKRQKKELLEEASAAPIRKLVKASKSKFKSPKFNTLDSHKRPTSSGKPPKKAKKVSKSSNIYADKSFKKANIEGKSFKSKKKFKRR